MYEAETVGIRILKKDKERLDKLKEHPKQPYHEVVSMLVEFYDGMQTSEGIFEFLKQKCKKSRRFKGMLKRFVEEL